MIIIFFLSSNRNSCSITFTMHHSSITLLQSCKSREAFLVSIHDLQVELSCLLLMLTKLQERESNWMLIGIFMESTAAYLNIQYVFLCTLAMQFPPRSLQKNMLSLCAYNKTFFTLLRDKLNNMHTARLLQQHSQSIHKQCFLGGIHREQHALNINNTFIYLFYSDLYRILTNMA